jgi:hypothetical protein
MRKAMRRLRLELYVALGVTFLVVTVLGVARQIGLQGRAFDIPPIALGAVLAAGLGVTFAWYRDSDARLAYKLGHELATGTAQSWARINGPSPASVDPSRLGESLDSFLSWMDGGDPVTRLRLAGVALARQQPAVARQILEAVPSGDDPYVEVIRALGMARITEPRPSPSTLREQALRIKSDDQRRRALLAVAVFEGELAVSANEDAVHLLAKAYREAR